MKLAVCDDNREELEKISSILECAFGKSQPNFQIRIFQNGFSLLDAIDCGEVFDVVLLDILMPGENGIAIAREIRNYHAGMEIIFLTSSPEYAVESYEVRANNYLLKPVNEERLLAAVQRCLDGMEQKRAAGFIVHSTTNQYARILYAHLMYGEAMRKSVGLHLSDQTVVSSAMTFTELSGRLEGNPDFVKVHRSYIVNMQYIANITRTEIVLLNGEKIPVSKSRYAEVSQTFFNFAFSNSFGGGREWK